MFNLKFIIAGVVLAALIIGGVIEIRVRTEELVNVPGRLLAFVKGEELMEQGQDYVKDLVASFKSDKSENESEGEETEEKDGEVAGAKDGEGTKKEGEEAEKKSPTLTIPLRF